MAQYSNPVHSIVLQGACNHVPGILLPINVVSCFIGVHRTCSSKNTQQGQVRKHAGSKTTWCQHAGLKQAVNIQRSPSLTRSRLQINKLKHLQYAKYLHMGKRTAYHKTRAALEAPGFRVPNGPAQWAHISQQIVWGRAPPFAHE